MKPLVCVPILILFCVAPLAWADIYTYSADDGAVSLSNVPPDSRYTILIPSRQEAVPVAIDSARPVPKLANKELYNQVVAEIARTYGLDRALLHAVISVESRYVANAVSKKGAAGLMQLMPRTAKRYGVADSFDPVQNLHGGAKYLRYLLKIFNNDMSLVLAAYNAGESAVIKHGNRIPPFRETESYVPRVLAFYRMYQSESI